MTRFVLALALASILSTVNDLLNVFASLGEPGPALASAITLVLNLTVTPACHDSGEER